MPGDHSDHPVSDYRLAPAYGARVVGGLLVGLAVLLFAVAVLVGVLGLPADLVVVVGLLGVAGVVTVGYLLTRRVPVVHLGPEGYRVRLVRGVGVAAAAWTDVEEAVAATPGGQPVLVLKLADGRSTTIPVTALAADREAFARDLRDHLQRGQRLRPL